MFEQALENVWKMSDSTIAMQQEIFNKWARLWPGVSAMPPVFAEPMQVRKEWVEVVGDLIKRQRESLEAQFSVGLGNIEEAFHLVEAQNPEEVRSKIVARWQKTFDCLRQTCEAQARDFQAAMGKGVEIMTKGFPALKCVATTTAKEKQPA